MFVEYNSRLVFQSNKRRDLSLQMPMPILPGHIFYWATVWLRVVNITVPLEYQTLPLIDLKGVTFYHL